jgi:hypothetical protein
MKESNLIEKSDLGNDSSSTGAIDREATRSQTSETQILGPAGMEIDRDAIFSKNAFDRVTVRFDTTSL